MVALVVMAVMAILAMLMSFAMTAVLFLIMLDVFAVVPIVADEEHGLAAGVVLVTILFPVFGVTRRYMQIERRTIPGN